MGDRARRRLRNMLSFRVSDPGSSPSDRSSERRPAISEISLCFGDRIYEYIPFQIERCYAYNDFCPMFVDAMVRTIAGQRAWHATERGGLFMSGPCCVGTQASPPGTSTAHKLNGSGRHVCRPARVLFVVLNCFGPFFTFWANNLVKKEKIIINRT